VWETVQGWKGAMRIEIERVAVFWLKKEGILGSLVQSLFDQSVKSGLGAANSKSFRQQLLESDFDLSYEFDGGQAPAPAKNPRRSRSGRIDVFGPFSVLEWLFWQGWLACCHRVSDRRAVSQ